MASQLRVDEIIASTGSSVAIGTAGESVTISGEFSVDASKGLNVGTGATIFSPSSNVLTLGTNSAERVRINSSGSVGIGTDNPSGNFDIFNTSRIKHVVASNTNHIEFWKDSTPTYAASIGLGVPAVGSLNQDLTFSTYGGSWNERLRITSSGNVGIGTDNPGSNKLQVQGGSAFYGNGGASATWGDTSYLGALTFDGSAQPVIRAASSKALIFQVNQSTEAARFNTSGNLAFPSGQGIDFSATADGLSTASSELLDDYEEGIWTPTIRLDGGTANGTTVSPESAMYKGRYVKIGDMVFVEAYVRYNFSTLTGTWATTAIQGLPYTQGNQNSQQYAGVHIAYLSNFYSGFPTTNNNFPAGYVRTGNTDIILTINNPNGAETTISNSVLSTNASAGIMFSAYYRDSDSG